jgi:two-component SAPR family response regulator
VDALAFEDLVNQNDCLQERQPSETSWIKGYEQAVALYRGHFLGDDEPEIWAKVRQDRLRQKFVRAVERLKEYWTETGNHAKATHVERRAREIESALIT